MQAPGDRQSHPNEPSKFGAGVRIDLRVRNQSRGVSGSIGGRGQEFTKSSQCWRPQATGAQQKEALVAAVGGHGDLHQKPMVQLGYWHHRPRGPVLAKHLFVNPVEISPMVPAHHIDGALRHLIQ